MEKKQLLELNLTHSQYEIFSQISPQPISKKITIFGLEKLRINNLKTYSQRKLAKLERSKDTSVHWKKEFHQGFFYSNAQAIDSLNTNPNPIIITSVSQSQLSLQFNMPYNTTTVPNSNCSLSVYLELINNNNSTLTTITSSGSTFFDSVQKTF